MCGFNSLLQTFLLRIKTWAGMGSIVSGGGAAALLFVFCSFGRSGSYWAYNYLGPRGLDAWTQIFSQVAVSFGLQPNQWEIEVQKIFNVSLTRFQLNAGEKIRDGAFEFDSLGGADFRPLNSRQICQGVKINATGWRNVSLFWFVTPLVCRSIEFEDSFNSKSDIPSYYLPYSH